MWFTLICRWFHVWFHVFIDGDLYNGILVPLHVEAGPVILVRSRIFFSFLVFCERNTLWAVSFVAPDFQFFSFPFGQGPSYVSDPIVLFVSFSGGATCHQGQALT